MAPSLHARAAAWLLPGRKAGFPKGREREREGTTGEWLMLCWGQLVVGVRICPFILICYASLIHFYKNFVFLNFVHNWFYILIGFIGSCGEIIHVLYFCIKINLVFIWVSLPWSAWEHYFRSFIIKNVKNHENYHVMNASLPFLCSSLFIQRAGRADWQVPAHLN